MNNKLGQTIKWFLKDTPNDAELNLKDLKTNPCAVKKQLLKLGYRLAYLFPKFSQGKCEYLFAKKDKECFTLTLSWSIFAHEFKLKKSNEEDKVDDSLDGSR